MEKRYLNKILLALKGFVRLNWGAPFIVLFLLFLIGTGVCSSIGLSSVADALSIFAYYLLIAGIALQFFCLLKYRKRPDDSRDVT
jgi:hypothetical protein